MFTYIALNIACLATKKTNVALMCSDKETAGTYPKLCQVTPATGRSIIEPKQI